MGRDRRKRDRRQPADTDEANTVEGNTTADAPALQEPRGQREPRNRSGQERREAAIKKNFAVAEQPSPENNSEKKEETKDASLDPAVLFANLKRETDDIKALTEKKFAKRQIFSNWSRYDEPLPDPVQEQEFPGADFNALCAKVTSDSSYFQLKSERSWDTNISALSSELFSLNADNLAASLSCIPFYEKLDLPIKLFSEADVQKMESSAKSSKDKYELLKSDFYKKKEMDILNILRERSNAENDLPLKAEREKTPDHKTTLSFSIDRPETPDECDRNMMTEMYEQVPDAASSAARCSAGSITKDSPEVPKMSETNMISQNFRTNIHGSSPEKQKTDLEGSKENIKRLSPESNFNSVTQREIINRSPLSAEKNLRISQLIQTDEPSRKAVYGISKEIKEDIPEKLNMASKRALVSPVTEKKKVDKEFNDTSLKVFSNALQQSESVFEEPAEECEPEPISEILPPRQSTISKSKDKKKQHNPEVGPAAVDSEIPSDAMGSEMKTEAKTVSDTAVNEDVRPQEEVQKSVESLGQRSKKRRSREKGQHANKPAENSKMLMQDKSEITNTIAEEKPKPLAQETVSEKAKSPSPENSSVKPQSTPQQRTAEIEKPKPEKMVETAKVKQEKPVEKIKPKQEKPVEKVKPKQEKLIEKAPAQVKTVEKVKQDDDLDFLLSLKKPVRESQLTSGASTQVSKPSIEKDDTSVKPAAFKFTQQTEDLEDWLDSVLDD